MGLKARDQQEGTEMEIVKESKGEYQREKEKKNDGFPYNSFVFLNGLQIN